MKRLAAVLGAGIVAVIGSALLLDAPSALNRPPVVTPTVTEMVTEVVTETVEVAPEPTSPARELLATLEV